MDKRVKWIIGAAAFAFGLVLLRWVYGGVIGLVEGSDAFVTPIVEEEQTEDGEEQKLQAPDISFQDENGNAVSLSDFQGKPVILNCWASWCPPCKAEMPDFDLVYGEYGDEITFLMVDMVGMNGETEAVGKAYVGEAGYSFPVYFDSGGEVAQAFLINSIPRTYFIDAEGYLVTYATGTLPEESLRMGVGILLGEIELPE